MHKRSLALLSAVLINTVAFAGNPHGGHGGNLPPGLQKKAAHSNLPPGWQKKLSKGTVLDTRVYEHAHVEPYGDRKEREYAEDKIIQVLRGTHEIIHIIDDLRH